MPVFGPVDVLAAPAVVWYDCGGVSTTSGWGFGSFCTLLNTRNSQRMSSHNNRTSMHSSNLFLVSFSYKASSNATAAPGEPCTQMHCHHLVCKANLSHDLLLCAHLDGPFDLLLRQGHALVAAELSDLLPVVQLCGCACPIGERMQLHISLQG